jgi:pimeloyl-ACP methyl ester carboxylesterase
MSELSQHEVRANGLRFTYLEAGEGPLVLLLHGFPDNAWTWEFHAQALASTGYRVVAQFLRGYPPTEIPAEGRYDARVLAEDLESLIEALGEDDARVVGHDWGAVMAYAGMAYAPERIARAVVVAVNHPQLFLSLFASPEFLHQSFHLWLFQLDGYAEGALSANDFALVDYLWRFWSPQLDAREHVARVKRETIVPDGAMAAALGYYRDLLRLPAEDPQATETFIRPTEIPTLQIFGADDPIAGPLPDEQGCFAAPHRTVTLPDAGHFVHRDRPREVGDLILRFFAGASDKLETEGGGSHGQKPERIAR